MALFIRTFIRIFAFFLAISVFFFLIATLINFTMINEKNHNNFVFKEGDKKSNNKIALLRLNGPILIDPPSYINFSFFNNLEIIYANNIKKLLDNLSNEKINGLIVSINSPGGSVSGSYKLYTLLNNFKKNNDVKIFFHTEELMASGAYWAALSGNKIYANYGSLIGSIGVKGPDWIYFEEPLSLSTGMFGTSIQTKKGIKKFNNIAGDSKDIFDPFRKPTKKEIGDLQKIVQNTYNDFVNTVSKSRKIENKIILNEIRAMIYDTKTAKEKFLIDNIADLDEVINFMITSINIDNYQIIEQKKYESNFLYQLIESRVLKNYFLYDFNKSQINKICNIAKFGLSSIVSTNDLISKC